MTPQETTDPQGRVTARELKALLEECSEFLDNYVDVLDGDDGQPRPNHAMSLKAEVDRVRAALQRAEGQ